MVIGQRLWIATQSQVRCGYVTHTVRTTVNGARTSEDHNFMDFMGSFCSEQCSQNVQKSVVKLENQIKPEV